MGRCICSPTQKPNGCDAEQLEHHGHQGVGAETDASCIRPCIPGQSRTRECVKEIRLRSTPAATDGLHGVDLCSESYSVFSQVIGLGQCSHRARSITRLVVGGRRACEHSDLLVESIDLRASVSVSLRCLHRLLLPTAVGLDEISHRRRDAADDQGA